MAAKRAAFPRQVDYARTFLKDWEILSRSGRFDMSRLKSAMMLPIAGDGPRGPEFKDHPLKGDWSGYRECHVGGDFLLIYRLDGAIGRGGGIIFARAGTHSELFNE